MSTALDELRRRFQTAVQKRVPVHVDRLRWDRERIATHQRSQLRRLLLHAIAYSPFHARRLDHIDPETFEVEELPSLPVMTKEDMMAAFDDVVTDRRLTSERVDAHLAATDEAPTLLDESYFAIASGGSSGRKGRFIYDVNGMAECAARVMAPGGPPKPGRFVAAAIISPSAAHIGRILSALLSGDTIRVIDAPVTLPLAEIVRRLNDGQPDVLIGYPSILHLLAREQRSGHLSVRPTLIRSGTEQLNAEAEADITAAFDAPIFDTYGTSEGLIGIRLPGEKAFTFATDLTVVELVDEDNGPVPEGTPSERVLVTNLFNRVQPLIRYVLEDRLTRRPATSEHGHLVATVEGRSRVAFEYGNRRVHSLTVLTPVIETPGIMDYQIRQTPDGIAVDVLSDNRLDTTALAAELTRALADAGLAKPQVHIRIVERFSRDPQTGKLRRLVPLDR